MTFLDNFGDSSGMNGSLEDMVTDVPEVNAVARPDRKKTDEELRLEARKETLNQLRSRYPKTTAKTFLLPLKEPMAPSEFGGSAVVYSGLDEINFIELSRMTVGKKSVLNRHIIANKGKLAQFEIAVKKMQLQIIRIGKAFFTEEEDGEFANFQVTEAIDWAMLPDSEKTKFINEIGVIDEQQILEAMTALDNGYGNLLDFYASSTFAELKMQQEELFQQNPEGNERSE